MAFFKPENWKFWPSNQNFDIFQTWKLKILDNFLPKNQNLSFLIPENCRNIFTLILKFWQFLTLKPKFWHFKNLKTENCWQLLTFKLEFWQFLTLKPKFWQILNLETKNFDPQTKILTFKPKFWHFKNLKTRILTIFDRKKMDQSNKNWPHHNSKEFVQSLPYLRGTYLNTFRYEKSNTMMSYSCDRIVSNKVDAVLRWRSSEQLWSMNIFRYWLWASPVPCNTIRNIVVEIVSLTEPADTIEFKQLVVATSARGTLHNLLKRVYFSLALDSIWNSRCIELECLIFRLEDCHGTSGKTSVSGFCSLVCRLKWITNCIHGRSIYGYACNLNSCYGWMEWKSLGKLFHKVPIATCCMETKLKIFFYIMISWIGKLHTSEHCSTKKRWMSNLR